MVNAMDDKQDPPDGLRQLEALLAGGLKAPIGRTLGFDLVQVERGRVVFEGKPDQSVYNPMVATPRRCSTARAASPCTPRSARAAVTRRWN
jgi:hypothetical protein